MNITLADGTTIGGSDLISAVYRTDLVPVPVTLELVTKAKKELTPLLKIGMPLLTVKGVELIIVKSRVINEQSIKAGRRIAALHVVAVLKGCEPLLGVTTKAVSLEGTSFNEVYRALGASVAITKDISLASFICLKGRLPTVAIAAALQRESAVVCKKPSGVEILRLGELMSGEVTKFDKLAVQWIEHPNAIKHDNTNYMSIDDDGTEILGQPRSERTIRYYPRVDNRELQNLRRILVTKATITRQLDDKLEAGKVADIDGRQLSILTAAHRYESGALGGRSMLASKAWLAEIEG